MGTGRPVPPGGLASPGLLGAGAFGGAASDPEAALAAAANPLGFSLNLTPAPAFSSVSSTFIGGGKSTKAGLSDSAGLTGEPGAGFAFSVTAPAVPAAVGGAARTVGAPIAGRASFLGSTSEAGVSGFAGGGSKAPAGVAGDGAPPGGGAFTGGFSSPDGFGTDGLIAMLGLSLNDGGAAVGSPAAEGNGGGAAGATGGGGDGAAAGEVDRKSVV